MDLLRLVLARQPLDKLFEFPRLSPHFWRLRVKELLHEDVLSEDYAEYFIFRGELASLIPGGVEVAWLMERAIFLRRGSTYAYYASLNTDAKESPVLLERALLTDIPEIQAAAISRGWFSWATGTGERIRWTPQLEAAVLRYGPKRPIPTNMPIRSLSDLEADMELGAVIRKILKGRETIEQSVEMTVELQKMQQIAKTKGRAFPGTGDLATFVEEGYLFPLMSLSDEDNSITRIAKVNGVIFARKPLLEKFRWLSLSTENLDLVVDGIAQAVISIDHYWRVKSIHADTALFQSLEYPIQIYYLLILGYHTELPIRQPQDDYYYARFLAKIGRPIDDFPELRNYNQLDMNYIYWDDICYNPAWYVDFINNHGDRIAEINEDGEDMYKTKAFTLGQFPAPEEVIGVDAQNLDIRELPNYQEILATILGSFRT